jgi:hypothetical protein
VWGCLNFLMEGRSKKVRCLCGFSRLWDPTPTVLRLTVANCEASGIAPNLRFQAERRLWKWLFFDHCSPGLKVAR